MSPLQILIVEDDTAIADIIAQQLHSKGFVSQWANTGREGLARFREQPSDLILLDLTLPDMDGLALCRTIRQEAETPIIIISGRSDEPDRIQGLELGADDYLTKPISLRELTARVEAVLRRTHVRPGKPRRAKSSTTSDARKLQNRLVVGGVGLDLTSCRVEIGSQSCALTPNEFRLLAVLMRHPGQVFSREELLRQVWQDTHANPHLVEVHVANLRSKIEPDPRHPVHLQTVRSRGYRFAPD